MLFSTSKRRLEKPANQLNKNSIHLKEWSSECTYIDMRHYRVELTETLIEHWIEKAKEFWSKILSDWDEDSYEVTAIEFPKGAEIIVAAIAKHKSFVVPKEQNCVFANVFGVDLAWGEEHIIEVVLSDLTSDPVEKFRYQVVLN